MNQDAIAILSQPRAATADSGMKVQRFSILGMAYAHLHQFEQAEEQLVSAKSLCSIADLSECGELLRALGGVAVERGKYTDADRYYAESLSSARKFSLPWDEAVALMNLGGNYLSEERFDEAKDRLYDASRIAEKLRADDVLANTIGNLGWAYYKLGDSEKALALLNQAEQRAVLLGDTDEAVAWLTDAGHVYQDTNQLELAAQSHREALRLAAQINSKEDIITALEDLAHVSVELGQLDQANDYVQQVTPLIGVNGNRLDALDVMLAQGKIAAARRQDQQAEAIFRTVERDPASQTSMRLGAEHQLARLYEAQGKAHAAAEMYKTSLATFEGARDQLKNEDSKLPFLANATRIYDDYIHFLVTQGKTEEALVTADQSRARTLAQGLGFSADPRALRASSLSPKAVSRKAGATLLFYWMGARQSYLWAITPQRTVLFPLPAEKEIAPLVARYGKALQGTEDPLESGNAAGQQLYSMLVAPAAAWMRPGMPVMILADGALSELNFETLIVPGAAVSPAAARQPHSREPHYWIEDATVMAAPSLSMLAAAKPAARADRNLLLVGDAVSPGEDYPQLPFAPMEMQRVERHFAPRDQAVFAREKATPSAYLASDPGKFAYIHFVSHGVASRMDPLDSAIILSRPIAGAAPANAASEDSFKLYAREVMRHSIGARLVTISACYGSGTRAYAGEGLVGLSWAFLRAGAHNVVGALWEASDESTPRLMDSMYQGLQEGMSPEAALREAKLTLLHSNNPFRKPYYWAPFQIYTRL
jgi:CHAT domain-containing protein